MTDETTTKLLNESIEHLYYHAIEDFLDWLVNDKQLKLCQGSYGRMYETDLDFEQLIDEYLSEVDFDETESE